MKEINLWGFLEKYTETYRSGAENIAPFAFWKMKEMIKLSKAFRLENGDELAVFNNHLVAFLPFEKALLSEKFLNQFDCLSLWKEILPGLKEFNSNEYNRLYFNFAYEGKTSSRDFTVVDFDFQNENHYSKASEIINATGMYFSIEKMRHMTEFSAFAPELWFFLKDNSSGKSIAFICSTYSKEVQETDLDWVYVMPEFQKKGAGRLLIYETIKRAKAKSKTITVSGVEGFYLKCGFYPKENYVWAQKENYRFYCPPIQP